MDIHFTFTTEWHDEAAHSLLSKLGLILSISHNELILGNAVDGSLRKLLEELAHLELFDIYDTHCLVLHDLDALFKISLLNGLSLLGDTHFQS